MAQYFGLRLGLFASDIRRFATVCRNDDTSSLAAVTPARPWHERARARKFAIARSCARSCNAIRV
jgi:hypothetical protein